jgi:prefoldin subunit 5
LEKYEKEKEYYEKELSKLNSKIDELEKEQKYMIKSKLYKFFKKKILRK